VLHWQKAVTEEPNAPAKLYLETENLITLTEATAHAHWQLNYNILHSGVRELKILTPQAWTLLSVACDGLQEWKPIETAQGPAVIITLAYAKKGTLSVILDAEQSVGEKQDVVEIPTLRPMGVEREQGTVGIEAKGAMELQVQESAGLNAIDPQELPGSLWQVATQPILFAFRYSQPYTLAVALKRHPEVPVLTTTVDEANAVTLVTDRGQMMTRIRYEVRNHLKQYLTLRLPEHAQLWSAFVAGAPVKPTLVENQTYRIPLAKSQMSNVEEGFPVEIVYYVPVPKFGIFGHRQATFPIPDAPVSRVLWSLYLPERYRFLHFGGDMEKGELASPLSALLGLARRDKSDSLSAAKQKEFSRERLNKDLQPMALAMNGAAALTETSVPVERQAELESEMIQTKPQTLASGVFPIAFNVPTSGQLFHFGQVMIVGQAPQITMTFVHVSALKMMVVILLASLALFLYRRRALWLPRVRPLGRLLHV
jgi:hypothetical protein